MAALFISINNRLTVSSHGAPSVHLASLPVSEKPAASAKCWYLLSSWFAPAPGEPRPEGRRAVAPKAARSAGLRPSSGRGSDPTLGSSLPCNDWATSPSRAFAPLHAGAIFVGEDVSGSFRWQAKTPPHEGLPQSPCTRPRSPRGLAPFSGSHPPLAPHSPPVAVPLARLTVNFAEVSAADRRGLAL